MIEHFIFLIYLLIITFSIIGHGYLFSAIIDKNLVKLNVGYLGFIGFFSITTISVISSFATSHSYIFNSILHLIGIFGFLYFIFKNSNQNIYLLKKNIIIFLVLLIGIYLYKNHDDFGYYHLTYSLNLSENRFMIGMGHLSHGYKTPSSLFYFHSTLYLPYIKYFLFHSGPFFIILFFNILLLDKIINKFKKSEFDTIYYFSLFCIIFANVVFYRIGEHGTDRSSQLLLLLIFIFFFELYYFKINNKNKNTLFNFLLILIFLAASIKALYYIYLILIPFILFKNKFIFNYLKIYNIRILFVIFLCSGSFSTVNFLSTGCILFPASASCNYDLEWSLNERTVKGLKTHFEWWAKAGGAPGYSSEMPKEKYVKNFYWLSDWIDRHFFNKVSDTLLGIIFIAVLTFLLFKNKISKNKKKFLIAYLAISIFFLEWFLNHPSMRYGGFVLFAIPIFFFTSNLLSRIFNKKKKIYYVTLLLIILSFSIYNIRNIARIQKEIKVYNYQIFKSPFFYVDKVETKEIFNNGNFIIYKPINKHQMCWASKTPCAYRPNYIVTKYFNFNLIKRK